MSNMLPTHSTRTATIAAMSGSGRPSKPMNATVPLNSASFWNPLNTKITESRSRPRKAAASLVGDMALLHLLAGPGSGRVLTIAGLSWLYECHTGGARVTRCENPNVSPKLHVSPKLRRDAENTQGARFEA